jgi:hypothetical protein
MLSFHTTAMNVYLTCVFSIAVLAVVLSIWVATTEVMHHRHSRRVRAAIPETKLLSDHARGRESGPAAQRTAGSA